MIHTYTPAEKSRLEALKEAEATVVDVALWCKDTSFLAPQQSLVSVYALRTYAHEEGFGADCKLWLEEIYDKLRWR